MKSQGFTLIELLVVIAIIGLLATLSVVSFSTSREKARISKGLGFSAQVLRSTGDDLIGRWDFDDCSGTTAVDSSGFGGIATLNGTVAWSTDTPSGKGCSIQLDGSANHVTVPDADRYSFPNNIFTFSFWMKTSDMTSFIGLLGKAAGGSYEYSVQGSSGGIYLATWNLAGGLSVYTPNTITRMSDWRQIVIVADGTNLTIYRDGSFVNRTAYLGTTSMGNGTGLLRIGAGIDGAGVRTYTGLMDDVRIYSRALSSKEIRQMYVLESDKRLVKN